MRKLLIVLAAAATLAAEPLTKSERDRGMSELHATRKMFLDAVAGLSEAQWSFKAAPDRWSIAECAEHIALSEDLLFGMATERVMNSPADPSKKAQAKGRDEEILKETADRSKKASAPEALKPSNKFPTRQRSSITLRLLATRLLSIFRSPTPTCAPISALLVGANFWMLTSGFY